MKRCACGRRHAPLEWLTLPLVGVWPEEETGGAALELRNCPCGSTIAVELPIIREVAPAGFVVLMGAL